MSSEGPPYHALDLSGAVLLHLELNILKATESYQSGIEAFVLHPDLNRHLAMRQLCTIYEMKPCSFFVLP